MTQHRKAPTPTPHPPAPKRQARGAADWAAPAVAWQRWMSAPLLAAEQGSACLERLQQHNQQALSAWWETLSMAVLEADHTDPLAALLEVPTRLIDRQMHLALQCCADNLQNLLDTESRWMEQVQAQQPSAA